MSLVDDRGRLLGRINIIDLALAVFVLVLLPIGYTAVRLFRVPQPDIQRVEPAAQPAGSGLRLRLHGRDFRPYLKVFVSPTGEPFSLIARTPAGIEGRLLVETPSVVEVELPALLPGQYDLYLFDETQEVAHRAGAFVLTPPPGATVRVRMRFSVPSELAKLVKDGDVDITEVNCHWIDDRPGCREVNHNLSAQLPVGDTSEGAIPATLKSVHISSDSSPAFELLSTIDTTGWVASARNGAKQIEADVDVPAHQNPKGIWEYRHQTIRAGDTLIFQTPQYFMRGLIDEAAVVSAAASSPPTRPEAK